jgi:hypothetical protein
MQDLAIGRLIALLSAVGFLAFAKRESSSVLLCRFIEALGFKPLSKEKAVAICGRVGLLYAVIALAIAGMWIIPAL